MRRFHEDDQPAVNNAKYLAILLIFYGLILGLIYLCTEPMVVRKIVLATVLPAGLCWLGLLTLTYFLIVNNRKWLGLVCMILTLLFSLAGNRFLVGVMARPLEQPFLEFRVDQSEVYDVIVLLGGGTSFGANGQSQLNTNGDRVMVAAQMYHQGKTKKIICTGSTIQSLAHPDEPSPGEQSLEVLVRAGVPKTVIELVDGRNTAEEIKALSVKFEKSKLKIGLISSAWHLPRVLRLASKHGLKVDAIPANFISGHSRFDLTSIVPSGAALHLNSKVAKELIAKSLGQ